MLELILGIMAIVAMVKIASNDGQSPFMWGVVTFVIVAGCIALIPLPLLRVVIALGLAFVAMIGYRVATNS